MDLRPEDADRLLSAAAVGEAVDGSVAGVLLVRLGAGLDVRDPSPALVAALVARLEASAPRPLVRRVAAIGIATVVVLGGTAAATNGSLPAPVQRVVHDVAAAVGADLPDPDEPTGRGGRVAGSDPPARGASTSDGAEGGADPGPPTTGGRGTTGDGPEDLRRDEDGDRAGDVDERPVEDPEAGDGDGGGGSDDDGTDDDGTEDGGQPDPTSPPSSTPPTTEATTPTTHRPAPPTPTTPTTPPQGPARTTEADASSGRDRARPEG